MNLQFLLKSVYFQVKKPESMLTDPYCIELFNTGRDFYPIYLKKQRDMIAQKSSKAKT